MKESGGQRGQQEKQWEKAFYLISKYHEEMFGPIVVTRYLR